MAKITDVARHASVSTATVSRVISQPELVSEATRTRVRAAISELSYEPNRAARSLRTLRASKLLVTGLGRSISRHANNRGRSISRA